MVALRITRSRLSKLPLSKLPRLRLELVAAALLTLGAIVLVTKFTQPAAHATKVSMQATPIAAAAIVNEDRDVAEFMEQFALSRLAPSLEDSVVITAALESLPFAATAPLAVVATSALPRSTTPKEAAPSRERVRPVALKASTQAPLRPRIAERRSVQPMAAPARFAEAKPPRSARFRIPVFSSLVEKLPSGRDIANGVSSLGRKVGSIFNRG